MKHSFFYFLILINIQVTSAQFLQNKFSEQELKTDFRLLRNSIERAQIGLYTYTTQSSLDSAFDAVENSITDSLTAIAFYRKIAPLHQLIANGHTKIQPSQKYKSAMQDSLLLFPLDVYWQNDTLFVIKNNSKNINIKPKDVITAINGIPSQELLFDMINNITRDGYNLTGPKTDLNDNFRKWYSMLKGNPKNFHVKIAGEPEELKLEALTLQQIEFHRIKRYGETAISWVKAKKPALSFEITGQTALMTIKTFNNGPVKRGGQKFKKFLALPSTKLNQLALITSLLI